MHVLDSRDDDDAESHEVCMTLVSSYPRPRRPLPEAFASLGLSSD